MLENKVNRTELDELGEFGLIERIAKSTSTNLESTLKGIGDDAAVIKVGKECLVFCADMLVEGVHFNLMYSPLKHLGYKAVVVNLSDIYAMNATPTQITVSIAVSNRFSVEAIDELYKGIHLACKKYNVDLVGGDITSSLSGLCISISAIGKAKEEEIVYRSGAQTNDLLVVSGDLGAAYMGLQVLEREKSVYQDNQNIQPDLAGYDYILERQLKPEASYHIPQLFAEKNIKPTSMIDISDGLASEIIHICKSSNKGAVLYENKIPIDPATLLATEDFNISGTTCALNGGEDYELLFTINQSDYEKIKDNAECSIIGYITETSEGVNIITKTEEKLPLKAQGWKNF